MNTTIKLKFFFKKPSGSLKGVKSLKLMDRKSVKNKLYKILIDLRKKNKNVNWWYSNDNFDDILQAMRWEINQYIEYTNLNEID